MKEYFSIKNKCFSLLVCGMCFFSNFVAAAAGPQVGIDANNKVLGCWFDSDGSGFLKIFGFFQGAPILTDPPQVDALTSTSYFHAYSPKIAISSSTNGTTAAAVWIAYDLSNMTYELQATTANYSSGWNTTATRISEPSLETPQDDYQIFISDDGAVIAVTWTAYVSGSGLIEHRRNFSVNGGANWSTAHSVSL